MTSSQQDRNSAQLRPILRSLLQKSVRRGYADISEQVSFCLAAIGDSTWVHARTAVIAFEECWPCARLLENTPSIKLLQQIALREKDKSAAGLGSLAYAVTEGDSSAADAATDFRDLKVVVAALKRPADFFKWAQGECRSIEQVAAISAAQAFLPRASWPWDKAFIIAGAYLYCKSPPGLAPRPDVSPSEAFPYWAAIDKHTPQGKLAIRTAARELKVPEDHLLWSSFYFESAKTNAAVDSPWWTCEINWRLAKLGLTPEYARDIWESAAPRIQTLVQGPTNQLLLFLKNHASGSQLELN